jgi:4-hydroxybenzoate polyprenyltransferase
MALSAIGWFAVVSNVFQVEIDYILLSAVFFITWFFYVFDRISPSEADKLNAPERAKWFKANQKIINLILFLLGLFMACLIFLRPSITTIIIIGALPCFFYAKKIKFGKNRFALKDLPGIKVVLVSFLWVLLIMGLIILQFKLKPNIVMCKLGLMVMLFVMAQIHINDIRDIEGDVLYGTKSLAALVGIDIAKLLGIIFIYIAVLIGFGIFNGVILAALGIAFILVYLNYSNKKDYYWRLLIELQGVIVYISLIYTPQLIS